MVGRGGKLVVSPFGVHCCLSLISSPHPTFRRQERAPRGKVSHPHPREMASLLGDSKAAPHTHLLSIPLLTVETKPPPTAGSTRCLLPAPLAFPVSPLSQACGLPDPTRTQWQEGPCPGLGSAPTPQPSVAAAPSQPRVFKPDPLLACKSASQSGKASFRHDQC